MHYNEHVIEFLSKIFFKRDTQLLHLNLTSQKISFVIKKIGYNPI